MQKVAIHSVPRSGSTWLGAIFDSHPRVAYRFQPLFSYTHKGRIQPNSSKQEIESFFTDILNTTDDFVLQKDAIIKGLVPKFEKSEPSHIIYKEVRYHHIVENLLEKDDTVKVIGLVRNPVSVLNSWIKAPKEFREDLGWKVDDEWLYAANKNLNKPEEYNGFIKWVEATLLFESLEKKHPDRFKILIYEQLVKNPEQLVKELFQFAGLSFTEQTKAFLSAKKQVASAYSVFKDKTIDKGKIELPQHIVSEIESKLEVHNLQNYFYGVSR